MFRVAEVPERSPYVAVIAKTADDVVRIGEIRELVGVSRAVAVAIHVDGRELDGLGNRWRNRFTSVAELGAIIERARLAGLEVHVHLSYVPPNRLQWVLRHLAEAAPDGGIDGLQVNNYSPTTDSPLAWWRSSSPASRVICALDPYLVREAPNNSPLPAAAGLIYWYGQVATDVLFDQSEGRGELLDEMLAFPVLSLVHQQWPSVRLGVAGGLGPDTMAPVERLADCGIWPLNICATTRLMTGGGVDLDKVSRYLDIVGDIDDAFGV